MNINNVMMYLLIALLFVQAGIYFAEYTRYYTFNTTFKLILTIVVFTVALINFTTTVAG